LLYKELDGEKQPVAITPAPQKGDIFHYREKIPHLLHKLCTAVSIRAPPRQVIVRYLYFFVQDKYYIPYDNLK
jgi:hypothetical protein